ncbi:hypothetical protein B0G38_002954 [Arthrobacter sp. VKM Ac-2550]|nr:hypothetical protein [Arthrobacter sp. VKM Ac-2550]
MIRSTSSGGIVSRLQTPPRFGFCLAIRFANLARVLVGAMPTQTGSPTWEATASFICLPRSTSSSGVPFSPRKDSSIE